MDVELHTTRQQFSREVIERVGIARDDMQALQRKDLFADFLQHSRLGVNDTVTTMSKGKQFLGRKDNAPWVYGLAGHTLS